MNKQNVHVPNQETAMDTVDVGGKNTPKVAVGVIKTKTTIAAIVMASIVLLLTSTASAQLFHAKKRARRYSKCTVMRYVKTYAKQYKITNYTIPLVAIALHESNLDHLALGDDGFSFGAWQMNTKFWKVRNPFHPRTQVRAAAHLFRHYLRRTKTLRGAIQRWNYNSRGYAGRVLKKQARAARWLRRCK